MLDHKPTPNRQRYLDVLRRMSPVDRLRKACELGDETRRLFKIGLAHRFPDLSEAELHELYLEKMFGFVSSNAPWYRSQDQATTETSEP
jgi:hypothetical protein